MAKKKQKPEPAKAETQKDVPLAEALIGLALKLGQEQELTLGELIGHMECAKHEVYERITSNMKANAEAAAAQAQEEATDDEPSEGADKPELEAVS